MKKHKSPDGKAQSSDNPRPPSGDGASEDLPFPETDYPPTLQRTLKRKFEDAKAKGDIEAVDRDKFFKTLGRTVRSQDESSDEEQ